MESSLLLLSFDVGMDCRIVEVMVEMTLVGFTRVSVTVSTDVDVRVWVSRSVLVLEPKTEV